MNNVGFISIMIALLGVLATLGTLLFSGRDKNHRLRTVYITMTVIFVFIFAIWAIMEFLLNARTSGEIRPVPEQPTVPSPTSMPTVKISTAVPTEEATQIANTEPTSTEDSDRSTQSTLPDPQRWLDTRVNAYYVKIDNGPFEFGSTNDEIDAALKMCYAYSGNLCQREAFVDEIVADDRRGRSELPDYWMIETEITNAQFDACIQAGECRQPDRSVRTFGPPDHPVRLGDVNYALQFAKWACGRLPTELEWEKAARGPDGLPYPWGTSWEPERANSCGAECTKKPLTDIQLTSDGYPETAPVMEFEQGRSPYGLYQMAGNVREWAVRDNSRPFSLNYDYMLKGGSFFDFPEVLRSADRLRWPNDNRYPDIITAGFRIVRDTIDNDCR